MFNTDFGLILLSFAAKVIEIMSTFRIFVLMVEYLLWKLEVREENESLLGVIFRPMWG